MIPVFLVSERMSYSVMSAQNYAGVNNCWQRGQTALSRTHAIWTVSWVLLGYTAFTAMLSGSSRIEESTSAFTGLINVFLFLNKRPIQLWYSESSKKPDSCPSKQAH